MPIYDYVCPRCQRMREAYVSQRDEDVLCELCPQDNGDKFYPIMQRLISLPAPHQVGGMDGKLRTGAKIRQRNEAYHRSRRGQEEHRANVEAARKRGLPA